MFFRIAFFTPPASMSPQLYSVVKFHQNTALHHPFLYSRLQIYGNAAAIGEAAGLESLFYQGHSLF